MKRIVVCLLILAGLTLSMGVRSISTRSRAGTQSLHYHLLWRAKLDANADSKAIVARGRPPKRLRIAVVLAGNNTSNCDPANPVGRATTYAFDARNGHKLWSASTEGPGRCTTAAPAVSGSWVYSPGLDGRVHRYALMTGREWRRGGWPKRFTRMPAVEKASANLVVSVPYLYVTTSGFIGDQGHYEGHLVTINLRTGHQTVFNSLCSKIHALLGPTPSSSHYCPDVQAGMFGRGQAAVDPLNRDVYVVTGNGPWNGHTNWGDSVLKLSPDGHKLIDAFTPRDQAFLNNQDLDLGSTGPAILPPVTIAGRRYDLLTQGGKGPAKASGGPKVVWLVNRDRMGSKPGPGHTGGQLQYLPAPGRCEVLTAPAVWKGSGGRFAAIYTNDCGASAYTIRASKSGKPEMAVKWHFSGSFTSPVVFGQTVYIAHGGAVDAFNPVSGHRIWSSATVSGGTIGAVHWEYPAISGKLLFMTDESGRLYAFRRR